MELGTVDCTPQPVGAGKVIYAGDRNRHADMVPCSRKRQPASKACPEGDDPDEPGRTNFYSVTRKYEPLAPPRRNPRGDAGEAFKETGGASHEPDSRWFSQDVDLLTEAVRLITLQEARTDTSTWFSLRRRARCNTVTTPRPSRL